MQSVSQIDPHAQIARKIRSIEATKVALLTQVADVMRGVLEGQERETIESLASLIGTAYLFASQLGLDLAQVDHSVCSGLPDWVTQGLLDPDEYERVRQYLRALR
ncbi:hypothetical protein D2Q93_12070 [Alicyclobacillaceae bacterium I2511]|nr:hypothetical protein D2Q93_12070 [Alicyclobacillaceae bacterium I2511]